MRLVVFDFDGTIYRGETARLFLRILGRDEARRPAVRRYYLRQALPYLLYRLGLKLPGMMARGMLRLAKVFTGMTEADLDLFLRRCLDEARPGFHSAALARLRAHLDAGDRVLLLSGTFTHLLALVAGEIGIDRWLGTELEITPDGRLSGNMGPHRAGSAKAQALAAYLAGQEQAGCPFDLEEAYAYADGIQDLPVLAMVGHPVAVNPDKRLRRVAARRGWEII